MGEIEKAIEMIVNTVNKNNIRVHILTVGNYKVKIKKNTERSVEVNIRQIK